MRKLVQHNAGHLHKLVDNVNYLFLKVQNIFLQRKLVVNNQAHVIILLHTLIIKLLVLLFLISNLNIIIQITNIHFQVRDVAIRGCKKSVELDDDDDDDVFDDFQELRYCGDVNTRNFLDPRDRRTGAHCPRHQNLMIFGNLLSSNKLKKLPAFYYFKFKYFK